MPHSNAANYINQLIPNVGRRNEETKRRLVGEMLFSLLTKFTCVKFHVKTFSFRIQNNTFHSNNMKSLTATFHTCHPHFSCHRSKETRHAATEYANVKIFAF